MEFKAQEVIEWRDRCERWSWKGKRSWVKACKPTEWTRIPPSRPSLPALLGVAPSRLRTHHQVAYFLFQLTPRHCPNIALISRITGCQPGFYPFAPRHLQIVDKIYSIVSFQKTDMQRCCFRCYNDPTPIKQHVYGPPSSRRAIDDLAYPCE